MKKLQFDICLSVHAGQFRLYNKHLSGDSYNPAAFIDQAGCDATTSRLRKELDKKTQEK